MSTSALCLRQSKPTPNPLLSRGGGGFSAGHEAPACSRGSRRGQDTRQISGVRPHVLKVCSPPPAHNSHERRSELFPSCGSVERCDSCNTPVAERYNTLKHAGGGGGVVGRGGEGRMSMAQVYKNRGKLHLQRTHSARASRRRLYLITGQIEG